MDEKRVAALLHDLDRDVTPRASFVDGLVARIDSELASSTPSTGARDFPRQRARMTLAAVAAAAVIVFAISAVIDSPTGRVRVDGVAGHGEDGPPADDGVPATRTGPEEDAAQHDAGAAPTAPAESEDTTPGVFVHPTVRTAPAPGSQPRESPITNLAVRLAFVRHEGFGRTGDLYARDLDDQSNTRMIAEDVAWPSWSPDGARLAVEKPGGAMQIITVEGDVVRSFGPGGFPAWSPDGERLTYSRGCPDLAECNTEVVVDDLDGSRTQVLGPGSYPSWSPDGRYVLYTEIVALCDGVYIDPCNGPVVIVDIDTGQKRRLPISGSFARMSPDGQKLAYTAGDATKNDVFVAGADGSGAVRVSRDPGDDVSPVWLPDSAQLIYTAPDGLVLVSADGWTRRWLGEGSMASVVDTPAGEDSP